MPLFSAAVSAATAISTWIGGLNAFSAFALKTAVAFGSSLLTQSLTGRPQEQRFALNGELQGGGDLSRSFILGRYATAGSLNWANTWGQSGDTPNSWVTQVIPVGDLPGHRLVEVFIDGEKVTYAPSAGDGGYGYAVPEYVRRGPNLYIKFHDGTQTTADAGLLAEPSTAARSWDATRVGRGVAYAVIHARCIDNLFNGFPAAKFVVDGVRLYDISRDSSMGGDGPQRWDDPETWGGDGDHFPVVQIYNLLRGLTYNGKWFYGLQGLSAARLPAANWIAQINKCRTPIMGANGLEPTYRSAGEISVDAPLSSAIEGLLSACQGRISEIGGIYYIHVGAPDDPTISFTDDDILSTEEQEFTPFAGIADTINGITATYPAPAEGWVTKTAPPLYRSDLEALDGNRRLLASVPLDFVPYPEQVQRLMKSSLEEARRFRRHTIVLPPKFWAYAVPGEIIAWTSERNGYVNKLMRIDGVVDRANLDVMIDITEVDPSDYDWDSGSEFHPPVDGAVGVVRPPAQPIVDWFATGDVVKDNAGVARRPAIRLGWDGSPGRVVDVVGIEFEVRLATAFDTIYTGRTDQPDAGALLISQGLLPNTNYLVRGRVIPRNPRDVPWSGMLPVTTPDVRLGDGDIYAPGLIEDLREYTNEATVWLRDGTRKLLDEQGRIARLIAEQDFANFRDKQTLRRELVARSDLITASYSELIVAATGPGSAIVGRLETLEAKIPELATVTALSSLTAIVTQQGGTLTAQGQQLTDINAALPSKADASAVNSLSARVTDAEGAITANADAITSVNTTVGRFSAGGKLRIGVEATPSGALARIGFSTSITEAGASYEAAFFLDAMSGGKTRAVFKVGQFAIIDPYGTTPIVPFIVDGGVVYIANVKIKQAQIDDLLVGTSNIVPGAITRYWINSATDGNQADGVALQLAVDHGTNSPPLLVFSSIKAGIRSILKHRLRLAATGASIGDEGFGGTPMNSSSAIGIPAAQNEDYTNITAVYQPPAGVASTTFEIWVSNLGIPGGQQASWSDRKIVALQLKR